MESLTLRSDEVELFFELLHGGRVVSGLESGDDSKLKNCALALGMVVRQLKDKMVWIKTRDEKWNSNLKASERDAQMAFEFRMSVIEDEAQESCGIKNSLASMATLETKMMSYLETLEKPRMNARDIGWHDRRKRELDEELTNALETMSTLHKKIKE